MKNRLLASTLLALPAFGWAHGTGGVPHDHGDTLAWAALAGATALCWALYRGVEWATARRQAPRQ